MKNKLYFKRLLRLLEGHLLFDSVVISHDDILSMPMEGENLRILFLLEVYKYQKNYFFFIDYYSLKVLELEIFNSCHFNVRFSIILAFRYLMVKTLSN